MIISFCWFCTPNIKQISETRPFSLSLCALTINKKLLTKHSKTFFNVSKYTVMFREHEIKANKMKLKEPIQLNRYVYTSIPYNSTPPPHPLSMVCLSRLYHFKFSKGCLSQILLGQFVY